ncbi:hypothetical protein V1605_11885 [Enterobacter soli]|uniref:hypothetical protein n=1 Tax=Enterobacter soli TaxID=885040 RepID=UPI003754C248
MMYKRYRVKLSETEILTTQDRLFYKNKGDEILEKMRPEAAGNMISRLFDNLDVFDARLLTGEWFPPMEADVFISHSHRDVDKAVCFVGWLYEHFGVKAFVDAKLWHYADDLLKEIDNRKTKLDSGHYSYESRNISTAHSHVMLMSSLLSMMDKTECLLFIEGENALSCSEPNSEKTSSPWIYTELMASKLMRINEPKRTIYARNDSAIFEHAGTEALSIEYPINDILHDIPQMTSYHLQKWHDSHVTKGAVALDTLYGII